MKKIVVAILIFMSFATQAGYAQLFKDEEPVTDNTNNQTSSTQIAYSQENVESNEGDTNNSGLFRSNPELERPHNGEGIGQEAPVGDGFNVLIFCGIIFGVIAFSKAKLKTQSFRAQRGIS